MDETETEVKLHLGCGTRFFPGFVHIDVSEHEHVDYVTQAHELSFAADDTVDLVYASHVLEYYDWQGAQECLEEWRRVLRPGGALRIAVPNFAALIDVYRKAGLRAVIGPLYGRMEADGELIFHKCTYDRAILEDLLVSTGFKDIFEWNWQEVDHGHIDDCSQAYFPHMNKQTGQLISLNLEARKA